ncbi:kynurenine/alpha-aminoadipate aminotransferase, mitochondrial-like [Lytechinus variegatus]|uniref:kynurenine/alpha-aminoadipate aminotransferase, mitochondrial-like n=1 Tax=Lytechinus variegatus TaxID=7654 RepID=UPI001BB2183D|nr:kynurenine/alpha-aminoadipate aminotransferase, mitochondrial-like [Lytechinus variegatus]
MNYGDYLSESGSKRRPSPLRRFSRIGRESTRPLINMSPGLPNNDLCHFIGAKFHLRDGSTLELSEEDCKVAYNYGNTDGIKPLLAFLSELTVKIHQPPTYQDSDTDKQLRVMVNPGGCHGISSVAGLILSPGSLCLVQERSYPTFMEAIRCIGATPLGIKMEEDGPNMAHFKELLSAWDPNDKEKWATRPKLFYLVPNGNNPSGETVSLEKKKEIYALAQKYDFIILEDDAYYYMQYDGPSIPSFLSMDVDGRVIRCDSFAKILGAGYRLGWISGPNALVTRLLYHLQVDCQHSSLLSQVLFSRQFQQWGIDGFIRHTDTTREFYKRRRDIIAKAAEDHLTGLATWSVPRAGLFMWIKLLTIRDAEEFLLDQVLKNDVLLTPGIIFLMDQSQPSSYIRVAFSVGPEENLAKGLKILAETIQEFNKTSKDS